MELVNTTCADVTLDLTTVEERPGQKAAIVVAKLTFTVDRDGRVSLDSDDPIPVLRADVETGAGILPADTDEFLIDGVEVIVLGAAYAPGGRPVPELEVTLTMGERVHRAYVAGDRGWIGEGPDAVISPPAPFARMPMGYERAFGGTAEVWLDDHTCVPVPHAPNPHGRGFDPDAAVASLVEALGGPPGFPRHQYVRRLPNLEDPRERITRWSDLPRPYSWATRPSDAAGAVAIPAGVEPPPPEGELTAPPWMAELRHVMTMRGHPELELPELVAGTSFVLDGMTPEGSLGFRMPPAGVALDYHLDGRTGVRPLVPRRLVILPDERRFTLTFETRFRFAATEDGERSLRVRVVDGH